VDDAEGLIEGEESVQAIAIAIAFSDGAREILQRRVRRIRMVFTFVI